MVSRGEFLEYARVFGKHAYGTPKKWLEESRGKNLDLVLEIDVQGAAQVKQKLPESVAIFILPPSRQELERRLRSRGQDSDEEIVRRLAKARDEIEAFGKYYDYCVVNEDVERAGNEAQAIVVALRCRAPDVASEWNNFWHLLEGKTDECANQSSREPVCIRSAGSESRAADYGRSAVLGRKPENAKADANRV